MAKKTQDKDTAAAQVAGTTDTKQEASAAVAVPVDETGTVSEQTEQETPAAETERAPKQEEQKPTETGKTRQTPAEKSKVSALESVGKAAIKRHGFAEVYVTSDGAAFQLRTDAVNHAANLANKAIVKITK